MINYAHRGACAYAPENTIPSFDLGIQMKANGIETDVQKTKDGILVLFHDDSLKRICDRPELLGELTYDELLKLDFGIHQGEQFKGVKIPTFEEFLQRYAHLDIQFAIELKVLGIEKEVLEMIGRYGCYERTIITSNQWQALVDVRAIDSQIPLGYLTKVLSEELLKEAVKAGIKQICPRATILTKEWNARLREEGFSVRPWGVADEDLMKQMVELDVDGMTVNFPDKLERYLRNKQ